MTIQREILEAMIAEDTIGLLDLPRRNESPTPERRLQEAFAEITAFALAHGRPPQRNPSDIGEMRLAMRLESINQSETNRQALADYDTADLLVEREAPETLQEAVASDAHGLLDDPESDLYDLRHVPPNSSTPDNIAQRTRSEDFDLFESLFRKCHEELRTGLRKIVPFRNEREIRPDTFYVLRGVLAYVAAEGERQKENGRVNPRLRCIFENGTEADLLLRSFSSQLYRFGKRVTEPNADTLKHLERQIGADEGVVYVLRSLSEDPQVTSIPHLHKIGFTKRTAAERTSGADDDATFLGAPVQLVAEYEVPAVIANDLECLLHRFFASARLDAWFERDGVTVAEAREWFAAPLEAIDQAIKLIESESIQNYEYDPEQRQIRLRK